jgi:coiled-coil domain-containing protein 55
MMNISLSSAIDKKRQKVALNGASSMTNRSENIKVSAPTTNNVFGIHDDDDNDEDDTKITSGRSLVNRDIRREQDALKARASKALEGKSLSIYDFDGTYDQIKSSNGTSNRNSASATKKESRYISDMLQQASKRNLERDVIRERLIGKELAKEEENYEGKEKFITSAYKKKLAERQLWNLEEEKQREREEKEDTQRKSDGIMGFYSNFNKNVALGKQVMQINVSSDTEYRKSLNLTSNNSRQDQKNTNMAWDSKETNEKGKGTDITIESSRSELSERNIQHNEATTASNSTVSPETITLSARELRSIKLQEARHRYFQRRGITEEEARNERL